MNIPLTIACSGPGAPVLISLNEGYAQIFWHGTIGITLCLLYIWLKKREGKWFAMPSLFLSVFNPAWMTNGRGGDCGFFIYESTLAILIYSALALVAQIAYFTYFERNRKLNLEANQSE